MMMVFMIYICKYILEMKMKMRNYYCKVSKIIKDFSEIKSKVFFLLFLFILIKKNICLNLNFFCYLMREIV